MTRCQILGRLICHPLAFKKPSKIKGRKVPLKKAGFPGAVVERRRPQSSHGSTKTVRCAVIGWGHLSRASVIVVRICDENSALAPAPALEAMEADLP